MRTAKIPPVVSIVGKKNSGKTTLVVALARELRQRGYRIASVKHGHHEFEIDRPGSDSWRHLHEGETEAVLMVGGNRAALVMRLDTEEPDPEALIRRFYADSGYDLVLVEGYKRGPFPKIEVFRRSEHARPVYDANDVTAAPLFLAIVSDDPALTALCPVLPLDPADPRGFHVTTVADLIERHLLKEDDANPA